MCMMSMKKYRFYAFSVHLLIEEATARATHTQNILWRRVWNSFWHFLTQSHSVECVCCVCTRRTPLSLIALCNINFTILLITTQSKWKRFMLNGNDGTVGASKSISPMLVGVEYWSESDNQSTYNKCVICFVRCGGSRGETSRSKECTAHAKDVEQYRTRVRLDGFKNKQRRRSKRRC